MLSDHAVRSIARAQSICEALEVATAQLEAVCPSHLPTTRIEALRYAVSALVQAYRHTQGDYSMLDDGWDLEVPHRLPPGV